MLGTNPKNSFLFFQQFLALSSFVNGKKNWEHASATNWMKLYEDFNEKRSQVDICIIEGYCLMYGPPELIQCFDTIFYLECSIELCKSRRTSFPNEIRYGNRGWESVETYVEQCVWPFHLEHEKLLKDTTLERLKENNTREENVKIVCEVANGLVL